MAPSRKPTRPYRGFEQGPIRPPSEALSLLIRVTRNCPWNRCTFCPVYKHTCFSTRPVEHVLADIDAVHTGIQALRELGADMRAPYSVSLEALHSARSRTDEAALDAAYSWFYRGHMRSVFLQDANSLILKPLRLVSILEHLRDRFPETRRITSYGRSETVARLSDHEMLALAKAGLSRIHIGLESGSDRVLERVQKGATKTRHIEAGRRVVAAGISLSEYYMPGLGGVDLSEAHAAESADALNQINPDFIRLRTLAVPPGTPLTDHRDSGAFVKCSDDQIVDELHLFLSSLNGIQSIITSDHILNLFADLRGKLPQEGPKMLGILDTYRGLSEDMKRLYRLGRRAGILTRLSDLSDPHKVARSQAVATQLGATRETIEGLLEQFMTGFI